MGMSRRWNGKVSGKALAVVTVATFLGVGAVGGMFRGLLWAGIVATVVVFNAKQGPTYW